jgi:hypothetical protein
MAPTEIAVTMTAIVRDRSVHKRRQQVRRCQKKDLNMNTEVVVSYSGLFSPLPHTISHISPWWLPQCMCRPLPCAGYGHRPIILLQRITRRESPLISLHRLEDYG